MRRHFPPLISALVLAVVLDLVTKAWAERVLLRHVPVGMVGEWFRLTLGYNEGIAFGLFATDGPGVIIASSAAMLLLTLWVVHLLRMNAGESPPLSALGLFLGGGVANLIDRVGDGRVTDFLDLGTGTHRWPTFNLADFFILTGAAILIVWSYRRDAAEEPPAEPSSTIRSDNHGNEVT